MKNIKFKAEYNISDKNSDIVADIYQKFIKDPEATTKTVNKDPHYISFWNLTETASYIRARSVTGNVYEIGVDGLNIISSLEQKLENDKRKEKNKREKKRLSNKHSYALKYLEFLRYQVLLDLNTNYGYDDSKTYWLIPSDNDYFKILDYFNDVNNTTIDWSQKNKKYKVGDIVFLSVHGKGLESGVRYKLEVLEIDIPADGADDKSDYYANGQPTPNGKYVRFKLIEAFDNIRAFVELKNNGLKGTLQGPMTLNNRAELLYYIVTGNSILSEQTDNLGSSDVDSYTRTDFLSEVFIDEEEYDKLRNLLLNKKNIILQGAPGVGKTFTAKRLAYSILGEKSKDKVKQIQFHQSYSYEDFIQGFKPTADGGFSLVDGVFMEFCKKASADNSPDSKYFFIIDEINRGNISKILGELMMLIEKDYRGEENAMPLAYDKKQTFYVPKNVYIIGMMNTADRSLALIDYALRRRFSFYEVKPCLNEKMVEFVASRFSDDADKSLFKKFVDKVSSINEEIKNDSSLGSGFCIGHSYFMGYESGDVEAWINSINEFDIKPILREYWIDDDEKYEQMINKLDV